jgi:hypothetical protein
MAASFAPYQLSACEGERNVVHYPLVDTVKVFLLQQERPCLSKAKIKEGTFRWSTKRKFTRDITSDSILHEVEFATLHSIQRCMQQFLGNQSWKDSSSHTKQWSAIFHYRFTSYNHIWISSHKILVQSVTNMESTFTKTLIIWKNGTKESGGLTCCQITAGVIRDVPETNYKRKSMA